MVDEKEVTVIGEATEAELSFGRGDDEEEEG